MRHRWVLTAFLAVTTAIACGVGTSPAAHDPALSISVKGAYDAHAVVGLLYTSDFDIKNTGRRDIPKLDLLFDSGDKFLNHNAILNSPPCAVDWTLPGLACGELPVGDESVFSVTYEPKDAGNFRYVFEVANDRSYLPESDGHDYSYAWTQSVQGPT